MTLLAVRSEVLTAFLITIQVLWDMMSCRLVNSYVRFAGACRFCLQDARNPSKGNLLYLRQQV